MSWSSILIPSNMAMTSACWTAGPALLVKRKMMLLQCVWQVDCGWVELCVCCGRGSAGIFYCFLDTHTETCQLCSRYWMSPQDFNFSLASSSRFLIPVPIDPPLPQFPRGWGLRYNLAWMPEPDQIVFPLLDLHVARPSVQFFRSKHCHFDQGWIEEYFDGMATHWKSGGNTLRKWVKDFYTQM